MKTIVLEQCDRDPAAKQYVTDTEAVLEPGEEDTQFAVAVTYQNAELVAYFQNSYSVPGTDEMELRADVYELDQKCLESFPELEGYKIIVIWL